MIAWLHEWLLRKPPRPPGSGGVVYGQCDATCNLSVSHPISSLPAEANFHFFCGPKHFRVFLLANMFSASRRRGRLSLWVFPSADFRFIPHNKPGARKNRLCLSFFLYAKHFREVFKRFFLPAHLNRRKRFGLKLLVSAENRRFPIPFENVFKR